MVRYVIGVVAFVIVVMKTTTYAQDKLSVDKEHIGGVIEAHLASLDGWRRGDVLIRVAAAGEGRYFRPEDQGGWDVPAKYAEGPDASSIVVQEDMLFRMVFDFDKQKALVIGRFRDERQVFDALDDRSRPSKRAYDSVVLLNDPKKGLLARSEDGRVYQAENISSASYALRSSGVPDIRRLGWTLLSSWNCESLQNDLTSLASRDSISGVSHVGRDLYQLSYLGIGEIKGQKSNYDWDVKRNLPQRFSIGTDRCGTNREGSAKWRSIDGHNVPVSSRYMVTQGIMEGSRFYLIVSEGTVDMHWFSFNRKLPEDLFSEEILRDRKKLDEMLSEEVFEKQADNQTHENAR